MKELLTNGYYLTDGGMETTFIFHDGIELNHFASFELLLDGAGKARLENYFRQYLELASRYHPNFILETPTWRANSDWGFKLGYSEAELRQINMDSVYFLEQLKKECETTSGHILISGCIGPRGDGYQTGKKMSAGEAAAYHLPQVKALADAGADMVSAFTMNYSNEAIGIAQAAKKEKIPVVISYTLETDGRLPDGESLQDAIEKTDRVSGNYVSYYMINCAHPEHFLNELKNEGKWKNRISGIRANASLKSHAELDSSKTLDTGDCHRLAEGYAELSNLLPELKIAGGCCGTDLTHIQAIADRLFNKINPKLITNILLLLFVLLLNVFPGTAQNSEVTKRISAGVGFGKNSRQDLIFSPFIHSTFSLMNGVVEFSREARVYQQVNFRYSSYSPMIGKPWLYTEGTEVKTAGSHHFTYVDAGYSLGKRMRITNDAEIIAGGSFFTNLQLLNYSYSRIGNFGYFSSQNLGIFGKTNFSVNDRNNITLSLKIPLVSWVARSPYLVNDDEFIENTSSHSLTTSFFAFLKDGELASLKSFQYFDLALGYIFKINKYWDLGISWFYKLIRATSPRNLVSRQNSVDISAIFKF